MLLIHSYVDLMCAVHDKFIVYHYVDQCIPPEIDFMSGKLVRKGNISILTMIQNKRFLFLHICRLDIQVCPYPCIASMLSQRYIAGLQDWLVQCWNGRLSTMMVRNDEDISWVLQPIKGLLIPFLILPDMRRLMQCYEAIWHNKALIPTSYDHEFTRSQIAAIFVASIISIEMNSWLSIKLGWAYSVKVKWHFSKMASKFPVFRLKWTLSNCQTPPS